MKTKDLVYCGVFAALTAILSQISIALPFTPVPINLALLGIFAAGGLLGSKRGVLSVLVYIALGAVGLPVFAGFKGGLSVLASPTGGYIIGYVAAVFLSGYIPEKTLKNIFMYALAMLSGLAVCYIFGTLWFVILTKNPIMTSAAMCVLPFLPGDTLKILAGSFLCERVSKAFKSKI